MTIALWTAYPIVFGLTEGANKISVDAEIIAYGVLDVAAKLGFGYLLVFLHSHGDGDGYVLPDWMVNNKAGQEGADGRGRYGALGQRDD
jgi:bacteriorhodopsin